MVIKSTIKLLDIWHVIMEYEILISTLRRGDAIWFLLPLNLYACDLKIVEEL